MKFKSLTLIVIVFLVSIFDAGSRLEAATILVDSGEVLIDDNGRCSLSEAIINANDDAATHDDCAAGSGSDTLQLTVSTYSITSVENFYFGPNGLPPIESTITIMGNGATIQRMSGAPNFRLFFVAKSDEPALVDSQNSTLGMGSLILEDLVLEGGMARGGDGGNGNLGGGGGAGLGGAIFNRGSLTLRRCTLIGNMAEGGTGGDLNSDTGCGGGGGLGGHGDPNHGGGGGWGGDGQDGARRAGGGGGGYAGNGGQGNNADEDGGGGGGGGKFANGGTGGSSGGNGGGAEGGDGGGGSGSQRGRDGRKLGGGGGGGFENRFFGSDDCGNGGDGGYGGGGGGGSTGDDRDDPTEVCDGGDGGIGGGGGGGGNGIDSQGVRGRGGDGGFGGGGGGGDPNSGGDSAFGGGGGGNGGTDDAGFGGLGLGGGGGGAGLGGAIFNHEGDVTVDSSTFFNNQVYGGQGGDGGSAADGEDGSVSGSAIFNYQGTLAIADSTLSDNLGKEAVRSYGGSLDLTRSILANTVNDVDGAEDDCSVTDGASLNSADSLIERGTSCGTPAVSDDPQLGSQLRINGGLTPTFALNVGSPAIDAGGSGCPSTDQAAQSRPVDGDIDGLASCDIGAFEFQPQMADLSVVSISGLPDPIRPGDTLTFDVTVRNDGPDDAPNSVVSFSSSPSIPLGSCTLNLDAGETESCTTAAPAPSIGGAMTTTATLSSATVSDVNGANDTMSTTIFVDAVDPTLDITSPSLNPSSLGTVGSGIDLRGTAVDNTGLERIEWSNAANGLSGLVTGIDGGTSGDWLIRQLPLVEGEVNVVTLVAVDLSGRTSAPRQVTVSSRSIEKIVQSVTFDGNAVDPEVGAVLANPVQVTIDPALGVTAAQLFLNGERIASAAGSVLTYAVDTSRYPEDEAASSSPFDASLADYGLTVSVQLVDGRVVDWPLEIPVGIDSNVSPVVSDAAGSLWSAIDPLAGLDGQDFRDLALGSVWAVTAKSPRVARQLSETIVDGELRYVTDEVATADSALRFHDGAAWRSYGPNDLDDPSALVPVGAFFTAVAVDGATLWIGTSRGLIEATPGDPPTVVAFYPVDVTSPLNGPAGSWITALHIDADGDLWVGHRGSRFYRRQPNASQRFWQEYGGVSRLASGVWTQFRAQHGGNGSTDDGGVWQTVAGVRVTSVGSANGAVWVGSEEGLSIFEGGVWRYESTETGMPWDEIESLSVASLTVPVSPIGGATFDQHQIWVWVGGSQGAGFLRLVPPPLPDGTPQNGLPSQTGTWSSFAANLPAEQVNDVLVDAVNRQAWIATDAGVASYDPITFRLIAHTAADAAGSGRAGALARAADNRVSAAVALDTPMGEGRVSEVDVTLGVPLIAPIEGRRFATATDGAATVVLEWQGDSSASSYELFFDSRSLGRVAATSHALSVRPGRHAWTVRALFDGNTEAGPQALPRTFEVIDDSGPVEFLLLEDPASPTVRAFFRDDADSASSSSISFSPFAASDAGQPDLGARIDGLLASVRRSGSNAVPEVNPAALQIPFATASVPWRVDFTSESGGMIFGDSVAEELMLFENTLKMLTPQPVPGLEDVAGLTASRVAVLSEVGGPDQVRLFERIAADEPVTELAQSPLTLAVDASAITGLPGGGFATLASGSVHVYDFDQAAKIFRLGAVLALPSGLGTASDIAADAQGRLYVWFDDGGTDTVAFTLDLGLRDAGIPTPTALTWRQQSIPAAMDVTAIAAFSKLTSRPPVPERDYDPPADPPIGAGTNSAVAGDFTVYSDQVLIPGGGGFTVAAGDNRIDYFLRTPGSLSFDGSTISGAGDLYLDYDDDNDEFRNLFGTGGVKIAGGPWTLDVGSGDITGGLDFAVPSLGTITPESLFVLGLGELAESTSRSGIGLKGTASVGPTDGPMRFSHLFLADFGGTFHATFGETGLEGLKSPFTVGRLSFGNFPLVVHVEGGLDLSSSDVPPLKFAKVETDICPGGPDDVDCSVQIALKDLEVSDGSVTFGESLTNWIDLFTLKIESGAFEKRSGRFGVGADGIELRLPTNPEAIEIDGFFIGSGGLRFDGTIPIKIGRFNLEMEGLELVWGGDGEVDEKFALASATINFETASGRELLVYLAELDVPFGVFALPPNDFPTAKSVLVRLRETCDEDNIVDCACIPCVEDACQALWDPDEMDDPPARFASFFDTNGDGEVDAFDDPHPAYDEDCGWCPEPDDEDFGEWASNLKNASKLYSGDEFFKVELCDATGFKFTNEEIAIPAFGLVTPYKKGGDPVEFEFGGARITDEFIELTDPGEVELFGAKFDFDQVRLAKDGFFTKKAVVRVDGDSSSGGEDPKLEVTLRDFELGIDSAASPPVRLGLSGGGFQRYGFGVDVARFDAEDPRCDFSPLPDPSDPVFDVTLSGVPYIDTIEGSMLIDPSASRFVVKCLNPPKKVKIGPLKITDLAFGDVPTPAPEWAYNSDDVTTSCPSGGDPANGLRWDDPAYFGGSFKWGNFPAIDAAVVFDGGKLDLLRGAASFDFPGKHISNGVFLQSLTGELRTRRMEICGTAEFSGGPQIKLPIISSKKVFVFHMDSSILISSAGYLRASAGIRLFRSPGAFSGFRLANAELILGKVYRDGRYKGTGVYFTGNARLFYGVLKVGLTTWVYFDSTKFGGIMSGTFGVPDEIPIIGGYTFGRVGVGVSGRIIPPRMAIFGDLAIDFFFFDFSVNWRIDEDGFSAGKDGLSLASTRGFQKGYHNEEGLSVFTEFELLGSQEVRLDNFDKDSQEIFFTVDRDAPGALLRMDFSQVASGDADISLTFPDGSVHTPLSTPLMFPPDPDAPEPQEGDLPILYRKQNFAGAPADPGDPEATPPVLPRPARPALKEAAYIFTGPLAFQPVEVLGADGQGTGQFVDRLLPLPVPRGLYKVTVTTAGVDDASDALVEFLLDNYKPEVTRSVANDLGDGRLMVDWEAEDADGDDLVVTLHFSTDRDVPADGFQAGDEAGYTGLGGIASGSETVDLCAPEIIRRNITAPLHLFLGLEDGRENIIYTYVDSFSPCFPADAPPQVEDVVVVPSDGGVEVFWTPLSWAPPEGVELVSYSVIAEEIGAPGAASNLPVSASVPVPQRSSDEPPSGWVINEIHADVDPLLGDANNDGMAGAADRFVEIYNDTGSDVDLGDWTLTTNGGVQHVFAAGTVVPDRCGLVVFGGGANGTFGNSVVVGAAGLALDPAGDLVVFADPDATTQASASYGPEAGEGQAINRVPELSLGDFAVHSMVEGADGIVYSPGQRADGSNFIGCAAIGQILLEDLQNGREYRVTVTTLAEKTVQDGPPLCTCDFQQQVIAEGDTGSFCHPGFTLPADPSELARLPFDPATTSLPIACDLPTEAIEEIAGEPSSSVIVKVMSESGNNPPRIASTPRTVVEVGAENVWSYVLRAVDEDADALTLEIESGNPEIGAPSLAAGGIAVTPDPTVPNASGEWTLTFVPGTNTAIVDSYPIRLQVDDGQASTEQRFELEIVHFGQTPTSAEITSNAPSSVVVGETYLYDLEASLTPETLEPIFVLRQGPSAMSLDAGGRLSWVPASSDVVTSPHTVVLEVLDPEPGCLPDCTLASQAFQLEVVDNPLGGVVGFPLLAVTPSAVSMPGSGGSLDLTIANLGGESSDFDWLASIVDDGGGMLAFASGSPSSGDVSSGPVTLSMVATANPGPQPRIARLLITANDKATGEPALGSPRNVVVTQPGVPQELLQLTPSATLIGTAAQTVTVGVTNVNALPGPMSWTATVLEGSAYVTLANAMQTSVGGETLQFQVTFEENFVGERLARIGVSSAEASNTPQEVTITQAASSADLVVTQTADLDVVPPGDNVTFTVEVTNLGPGKAVDVEAEASLPPQLTFQGTLAVSGFDSCFNNPVGVPTCVLGEILPGQTKKYRIVAEADAEATVTSSVEVSSLTPDPNSTNNTAQGQTVISPVADLSIDKTAAPTVSAGEQLTYTLTVTNDGPDEASGVTVTDILAPDVVFAGASESCEEVSLTVTCDLGTLALGATTEVTITIAVPSGFDGDRLDNTASVTSSNPDTDPADNDATVQTTVIRAVDLVVSMVGAPDPATAGENLLYNVTVTNQGPSDVATVEVVSLLPPEVALVGTLGCAEDSLGIPACTLGTVSGGGTAHFTVEVAVPTDVPDGAVLDSFALLCSTETALDTSRNGHHGSLVGDAKGDVDAAPTAFANPRSLVLDGTDDHMSVLDVDFVQGDYTVAMWLKTTSFDPQALFAATKADETHGLLLEMNTFGQLRFLHDGTGDGGGLNIFSDDSFNDGQWHLVTAVRAGAQLVLYVDGTEAGTHHGATDFDAGLDVAAGRLGATLAQRHFDGRLDDLRLYRRALSAAEVASLAAGTDVTGSMEAHWPFDCVTRTADSNPDNDTASESTTVTTHADLSISKNDSVDPVAAGAQLTYTITVANDGPSDAQNVRVTDTLPADVTLISTAGCAEDPAAVPVCSLGTVAAGATAQYTMTVEVASSSALGSLINQASVASDTLDMDPSNDAVSEETAVIALADLAIEKTAEPNPVVSGTDLTYTVTVTNLGPSWSRSVVASDPLPAGVTLVSTAGCAEDPAGTPACSLGDLAPGDSRLLTIVVNVDVQTEGVINNQVTVSSNTEDPVSTNNQAAAESTVTREVDLALAKTAGQDPAAAGDPLEYTLTVTNQGLSASSGGEVIDTLPPNVAFVDSVDGCSETDGVVTCPFGPLAVDDSVSLVFTVEVSSNAPDSIVNTATVSGDQVDPEPANDTASETTAIDSVPPTVTALATSDDTGDGSLGECEEARVAINEVRVTFSEPVRDPAGDSDPDDVTNPENYLLLAAGDDRDIQTENCGVAPTGDTPVEIDGVAYDPASLTATLTLATALSDGPYRLLVCGSTSIRDLSGNALDGDGNGVRGDDFLRSFRVEQSNRLRNGHFDCDIDSWIADSPSPGEVSHSEEDADDADISGSVRITPLSEGGTYLFSQCAPLLTGQTHELRTRLRADQGDLLLRIGCDYFTDAECATLAIDQELRGLEISDTGGLWLEESVALEPPATAASALCFLGLNSLESFDLYLDDITLSVPALFTDGFESGDTSSWSATVK